MKKLFSMVCLGTLLTGCGGVELTPEHIAVERDRQTKEVRLAEEKSKIDKQEMEAIESMPDEVKGMAYMGKQMKEMFALVVDGSKKGEMTFYEYSNSIAKQKNDLARTGIKTGSGLLTKVGLGWLISDTIQNGQDKAGDRIQTGDGAVINKTKTESKSRTDTNQIGDGNGTGNVDASTTGPDKSSKTEVIAPEPEIPEVPEGEFVPTEPPAHFDDLPVDIPEIPIE